MDAITIHYGYSGPPVTVRETDSPTTWELDYPRITTGDTLRILKAAEHAVLRAGGDRLVVTRRPEQQALRAHLDRWPAASVSKDGNAYTIALIALSDDGLTHDSFDSTTPLGRIDCLICVQRAIQSRTRARHEASIAKAPPQHLASLTHLVAEAYTRLAQIEESHQIADHPYADQAA